MNESAFWGDQVGELLLPTARIRQVDRDAIDQLGMHSLVLMENAALQCSMWLKNNFSNSNPNPRTLVLCGKGNNGGDGLAITRHLRSYGWTTDVLQLGPVDQLSNDARANWEINLASSKNDRNRFGRNVLHNGHIETKTCESVEDQNLAAIFTEAELILDAMLGTGVTGEPRSPFDGWIAAANDSQAIRVAIDVPTGMNADSGEASDCAFKPHVTLTFVAKKLAMSGASEEKFGRIEVFPIGVPHAILAKLLASV